MAAHSSILAWRIPWTEEPGRLQSMGFKELDITEKLTCTHMYMIEFCDWSCWNSFSGPIAGPNAIFPL